jgi:transcriptional regulator with XRE-family HTH domain
MTGKELRRRITGLGLTYTEAAGLLGLSLSGLNHQMRGERPVTRQTEMLLERLEAEIVPDVVTKRKRRA